MIYPWQHTYWQQLMEHWSHNPHAWLFYGSAGIGKYTFAKYLAQALLCEQPLADHQPCLQCHSCVLFAQNSHPDLLMITPEETAGNERKRSLIKVEEVRRIWDFAHLTAHRGGNRVIFIYPAEYMNMQAANALLKILEEPPAGVVFILVSHHKDRLIATIKSRCRQIALPLPSATEALAFVQQQHGDQAEALLAFHGGTPIFTEIEQHSQLRIELLHLLAKPRLLAILNYAYRFDQQKLALATFLDWLGKWLLDLALTQQNQLARYYPQQQDQLNQVAVRSQPLALFALIDRLNKLSPYGQHTLNVKMQLEDLLIDYLALWQGKTNHH